MMNNSFKAMVLDEGGFMESVAALGDHQIIELFEVYGRPGTAGYTFVHTSSSTHRRFVSPWEAIDRQSVRDIEANQSSNCVPTHPSEKQDDSAFSHGGDGLPFHTGGNIPVPDSYTIERYDSGETIAHGPVRIIPNLPQPVDVDPSPPRQAQPPEVPTHTSDGRAAELDYTTVVCRFCGGRGSHFSTAHLNLWEDCAICCGWGYQSIQVEQ